MAASKYSIRKGSQVPAKRANQIGRELGKIRKQRGSLTAAIVVEDVTPTDHPLHDLFEWNNDAAAHAHRLEQARGLLRAVYVIEEELHPDPIRALVAIEQEAEMADYMPVAKVLSNDEHRRKVAAGFVGELRSWLERSAHLRELKEARALVRQAVAHATESKKRKRKAG